MPSTATSPNMGIVVPVVGVELGPAWAIDTYNALYTTIDGHDHTTGKGVRVPTAGLNINADLAFGGFNATALRTTRFSAQSATLTSGTDASCLYSVLGDAYWNDASGHQIRLTQNGNPVSGPWVAPLRPGTGGGTILSTDPYTLYYIDVSGGTATLNLPASTLVAAGRAYLVVDIKINAGTNNITIAPNGTNTINGVNAGYVISANGGEALLTTDGAGHWYAATIGGAAGLTAPVVETLKTNSANATYTIDTTGGGSDFAIWHAKSGNASYVLPGPTAGRKLTLKDTTGAIGSSANYVSLVPHAGEQLNGSTGFAMSGTAYHFTNGSPTVTATSSFFTKELYVGCSIASSNQAGVNYLVSAIGGDGTLTLSANFTGTTTTSATATRTSILFAANYGTLFIESDGTNWQVKGDGTPTTVTFNAAGTFILPPGGSPVDLVAAGGGGGGGGGAGGASSTTLTSNMGGAGGGAATERTVPGVVVTPNTAIAVAIGAGGAGGAAGAAASPGNPGQNGAATTFGTLAQFLGGSGGAGADAGDGAGFVAFGGAAICNSTTAGTSGNVYASTTLLVAGGGSAIGGPGGGALQLVGAGSSQPGNGGDSGAVTTTNVTASAGKNGSLNSATRGTAVGGVGGGGGGVGSTTVAGGAGGGGGGAGPQGQGGGGGGGGGGTTSSTHGTNGTGGAGANAGSNGTTGATNVGGAGGAGGAAANNSAAGGGGGGAGGAGNTTGGAGANGAAGGSGYGYATYRL